MIGDPLHYEWQNFIPREGPWQGIVLGFRDSMKTSQLAFCRPLWELGHDPTLRIKYVTCNDEKAKDHLRWMKEAISTNERLHAVFPDLRPGPKDLWLSKKIVVNRPPGRSRDASIEVAGITSNASGGRGDLLLFDDIIDYKAVIMQPRTHEKIREYFKNTWLAIGTRSRRILVFGIPTLSDDLLVELADNPDWASYSCPAMRPNPETGEMEATFPQWYPISRLEEQRAALGPRAFERQYMLKAISPDERFFNEAIIEKCLEDWEIGEHVHVDWPRYGGIDFAQSMKKKASYSVIFTVAVDPANGRRHPVEIIRAKMRPTELKKTIIDADARHHWVRAFVENNAAQDILVEWLGEDASHVPVEGYYTGSNKWDPDIGLPRLVTQMSQGGWVIPITKDHRRRADRLTQVLDPDLDTSHCVVCAWKMELEKFPAAATSDILMAQWFADAAATKRARPDKVPTVVAATRRRAVPTGWRA